ncbi:MAG: hypothetical protein H0T89_33460 [Deltaproteobacteria bacterium]|nr:hypothetical protein [Deltaproteobacteria bacterium]MDQ3300303.1 hypothetical protein [Myxococcota bacterium]
MRWNDAVAVAVAAVAASAITSAACYQTPAPAPPPAAMPENRAHARIAADPLGFLPIDAEVVAHLDAQQLRRSDVWQRFEPMILAKVGPSLAQFHALCGFDPLIAVRRVSIGLKDVGGKPNAVIVVRGIERGALMGCIDRALTKQPDAARVDRGIVTIPGATGQPPTVLGFADASTLVLMTGLGASVEALRAAFGAGAPLRSSPAFTELHATLETRRPIWFVINGSSKLLDQAAGFGLKPRAVFGSVELSTGLLVDVRMRLETVDQAQQVAAMAQGQLGAVQGFVSKLEVTAADADVVLALGMSPEQVETLTSLLAGSLGSP